MPIEILEFQKKVDQIAGPLSSNATAIELQWENAVLLSDLSAEQAIELAQRLRAELNCSVWQTVPYK